MLHPKNGSTRKAGKCECNEKDADVCRSMPEVQPSYCRVKAELSKGSRELVEQIAQQHPELDRKLITETIAQDSANNIRLRDLL